MAGSSRLENSVIGNRYGLAASPVTPVDMSDIALLKSKLRQFPDFPEKGILFEDIVRLSPFSDYSIEERYLTFSAPNLCGSCRL